MTVISVIVGSTREGRFSEKPAKWILQQLKKRAGVDARLLDLHQAQGYLPRLASEARYPTPNQSPLR
jgi:NAD(P)H-dependent FMN reductase